MKIKHFLVIALLGLSFFINTSTISADDGETPIGNRLCSSQPDPFTNPIDYWNWYFNC